MTTLEKQGYEQAKEFFEKKAELEPLQILLGLLGGLPLGWAGTRAYDKLTGRSKKEDKDTPAEQQISQQMMFYPDAGLDQFNEYL